MYDDLYGVQRYKMKYECGSLKRNSIVPPSLFLFYFFIFFIFLWPQWLFLFNSHLCSLGYFNLSSLGSFPHFMGNTLYITRSIGDLSHFTKIIHIKKMCLS